MTRLKMSAALLGALATVATVSTAYAQAQQRPAVTAAINTLTDAERAAGWKLLFDGKSLDAWRQFRGEGVPAEWEVVDGHVFKGRTTRDIITRDQFGDFELVFEWKLSEAGNAGVFYRTTEEYNTVYWSGPEYQLLDNVKAADNRTPLTRAGAAYGFYPAPDGHDKPSVFAYTYRRDTARGPDGAALLGRGGQPRLIQLPPTREEAAAFFAAGEWNVSKIVARGPKVEHWLNGFKLLEFDLSSADWEEKVQNSKFRPYPNFAKSPQGHIGIQGDHGGLLAFRNIKIRELR